MKKICRICGKEKEMFSWEDICYACKMEEHLKRQQKAIRDGEEDADTFSSDFVICPYCGNALETCYGYEEFPEIYEDGDHEIECPECEKTFILETTISYYYETRRSEREGEE